MDNLFFILAAIIIDAVVITKICWLDYINNFVEMDEMKPSVKFYMYFLVLIVLFMVVFVPYKLVELFNFHFTLIVATVSTIGMALFSVKYSKLCTDIFKYLRDKENSLINA